MRDEAEREKGRRCTHNVAFVLGAHILHTVPYRRLFLLQPVERGKVYEHITSTLHDSKRGREKQGMRTTTLKLKHIYKCMMIMINRLKRYRCLRFMFLAQRRNVRDGRRRRSWWNFGRIAVRTVLCNNFSLPPTKTNRVEPKMKSRIQH